MPISELRIQAYQLLALALKADEEDRSADAYDLTAKAIEHLEDANSVQDIRRVSSACREKPLLRFSR
jgi:hypothetical protein